MSKRREWSDAQKRDIVAETRAAGVTVASVAKLHGLNVGQLHRWIRDPRFRGEPVEPEFVEIEVEQSAPPNSKEPRIEITLVGGHRIVIEGIFDPASVVPLVRSFVA